MNYFIPSLPAFNSFHLQESFHHFINHERIARIKLAAGNVLEKCCSSLVAELGIQFALKYAFSAFLISQFTTVTTIASLAVTILVVIQATKKYFPEICKPHPLLQEALKTVFVSALVLKLNIYIHEYGHVLAALLCFINANPVVTAAFDSAETYYVTSYGLTLFGQLLGEHNAILFVTTAGLVAPVVVTIAEFAIAQLLKGNYPKFSELNALISRRNYTQIGKEVFKGVKAFTSEYLTLHGMTQLAKGTFYCINTFDSNNPQLADDYYRLWKVGNIHPLVTLAALTIIPLTQLFVNEYWNSYQKE
jgi:hypothetical protein